MSRALFGLASSFSIASLALLAACGSTTTPATADAGAPADAGPTPTDGATATPPAQGPKPAWVKTFGGKGEDVSAGVFVDPTGNVFLGGYFEDTIDFGGAPLVSLGKEDAFLAKFDPSGNHVWSLRLGGDDIDAVGGIGTDAAGNLYIAGIFSKELTLGAFKATSKGSTDAFLARLDKDGAPVWVKTFGSTGSEIARSLVVSPTGDLTIAGILEGPVDFGGGPVANKRQDGFAARFDKDGNHVWSRVLGGPGSDALQALAAGPGGDVWLAGIYREGVDVGTGPLPYAEGDKDNAWVVRLGPDGATKWARGFSNPGDDAASNIAVDAAGNAAVTFAYQGPSFDFGAGPQKSGGSYEMGLALLDPSGKTTWGKSYGTVSPDAAFAAAFDNKGGLFVSGLFSGELDYGSGLLVASGFLNNSLLKFDMTGKALWARDMGSTTLNNYGLFNNVTVDPVSGGAVSTGHYDGTFDYGTGTQPNRGRGDIYLVKLAP